MIHRHVVSRFLVVAIFILALQAAPVSAADFDDPDYQDAVAATAAPLTQKRVDNDLWALTPANTLHDLQFDEQGRVLLATWTMEYYDDYEGKPYDLSADFGVWLAPPEQIREFFNACDRPFSVERLEQAYGLPPESGYTRIVTMWIHPSDLVRPCPDPEVSDMVCGVDFPVGQAVHIDDSYKQWFANRRETIYDCEKVNCYPWTGLGYTYDWGPDAKDSHVGFSEYVKPQGHAAVVLVESVQTTLGFFGLEKEEMELLKSLR